MGKMRMISPEFVQELTEGRLSPLLEKVKIDSDLDLQIRNGYINVYFKGNNLIRVKDNFFFDIDKQFTQGISHPMGDHFESRDDCRNFVNTALPHVKERIISVKSSKRSLEIEFEQLLIRANNYTRGVNSEYFIIDRQYAVAGKRANQFDLVGIFSGVDERRSKTLTVSPFLGEVKYSLNSDISVVDKQIDRYYRQIASNYAAFIEQIQAMLNAKAELGLLEGSEGLINKFKAAQVDKDLKNLRILIILIDYNERSTRFNGEVQERIRQLEFSDQIYLFKTGFAMWGQNVPKIGDEKKGRFRNFS